MVVRHFFVSIYLGRLVALLTAVSFKTSILGADPYARMELETL
jgi:hypothetical protein